MRMRIGSILMFNGYGQGLRRTQDAKVEDCSK